jgi:diketogulonate reductase-like aldo/keto reductase
MMDHDKSGEDNEQSRALEAAYLCGLECIAQLNRPMKFKQLEDLANTGHLSNSNGGCSGDDGGGDDGGGDDGGYVDMLLLHWPGPTGAKLIEQSQDDKRQAAQDPTSEEAAAARWRLDSWLGLQQLYLEGRCRAIGVSNFEIRHLEELLRSPLVTVVPHVNQVECHVRLQQRELREWCASKGVTVQAHTPLGKGQLLQEGEGGDSDNASAHSLLQWAACQRLPVVVRSTNPIHLRQNAQSINSVDYSKQSVLLAATTPVADRGGEHRYSWDPRRVM